MAKSSTSRDKLIIEHQKYVENIAGQMIRRMNLPREILDELIAAGHLGLVEAADRFEPGGQAGFSSYAYLRIRGAMIDAIRAERGLSGRSHTYAKALSAAHDAREADGALPAKNSREQLALAFHYAAQGAVAFRLSFEEAKLDGEETEEGEKSSARPADPEQNLLTGENKAQVRKALECLSEKERCVITEYYFHDKRFSEIADENETLSKSWISRLHANALAKLQKALVEESAAGA